MASWWFLSNYYSLIMVNSGQLMFLFTYFIVTIFVCLFSAFNSSRLQIVAGLGIVMNLIPQFWYSFIISQCF